MRFNLIHRHVELDEILSDKIHLFLKKRAQANSKKIAQDILRLSDFFIQNPSAKTPWSEDWCQIAYVAYFLPLNYLRLHSVVNSGNEVNYFNDLNQVIDFGAGLGAGFLNLNKSLKPKKSYAIELASEPEQILKSLELDNFAVEWVRDYSKISPTNRQKSLVCFSYSLTELKQLPDWCFDHEALMIVEPATREDGRKLLQTRDQLIKKGYSIWAPCTHQENCPLLTESKTDWCHDRVHLQMPEWFLEIEQHLPIKNSTVTMSYLLARKSPPPPTNKVRITGDLLKEKGKDRQLICRNQSREFLSWMYKNKLQQSEIPRGILIDQPQDFEKIANELRLKSAIKN